MFLFNMLIGNLRHGKNHTVQTLKAQLPNVHRFSVPAVLCIEMLPERCKLLAAVEVAHQPFWAFTFVKA